MSKLSSYFYILFWLLPYFILIPFFSWPHSFDLSDFIWALKNSVYQSLLSALIILVSGYLGSQSLNYILKKWQKYAFLSQVLFMLPSFIPTIFILLSVFKLVNPFPFGLFGVSLIQWFIYSGLASVLIFQIYQNKIFYLENISLVDGVSRFRFLYQVVIPLMKMDFIKLFVIFFSITFTSFSVPLVAGGGTGTNLEVLIYEKIRIQGDWGGALIISLFQVIFVAVLAAVNRVQIAKGFFVSHSQFYLQKKWPIVLFLSLPLIIFVTPVLGFNLGFSQLSQIPNLSDLLFQTISVTLFLSILTGLSTMLLGYLTLLLFSEKNVVSFLVKYVSPPSSFLCLSLLLLMSGYQNKMLIVAVIVFAFIILNTPNLFKTYFISKFEALSQQVIMAQALGASRLKITNQILWPQMSREIGFMSGISAFWASGDFAVVKFIAGQSITLAQIVESLLSSYRFYGASVLSVLLILIGTILLGIFTGLGYVSHKKFKL